MKPFTTIFKSLNRSTIAIALDVLVILLLVYINIQTGILYENSHGKNRALFGLVELIHFGYKYWLIIPAAIALALSLIDWYKSSGKKAILISLLSAFTCGLVFIRLWLLWVSGQSY